MRRLLMLTVAIAALHPARTSACVAVPNRHAELQRAVRAAMTCPGIQPGSYVVEVAVTSEPYGAVARLLEAPPLSRETQRCVELAFTRQPYALVRGPERIEMPFVFTDGWP